MPSLNRRQKHRNRTAVTAYLKDSDLAALEALLRLLGSNVSVSKLLQLGLLSLVSKASNIFVATATDDGLDDCTFERLAAAVYAESLNSQEIYASLKPLKEDSEDGNA